VLSQFEIEYLLDVLKELSEKQPLVFPSVYDSKDYSVISEDKRNKFTLTANRKGHKIITTCTFQNMHQSGNILLRLDLSGSPHTNPDGHRIDGPHLHIAKEGFGDSWAYIVPKEITIDIDNPLDSFINFLEYCKVKDVKHISFQDGLGL